MDDVAKLFAALQRAKTQQEREAIKAAITRALYARGPQPGGAGNESMIAAALQKVMAAQQQQQQQKAPSPPPQRSSGGGSGGGGGRSGPSAEDLERRHMREGDLKRELMGMQLAAQRRAQDVAYNRELDKVYLQSAAQRSLYNQQIQERKRQESEAYWNKRQADNVASADPLVQQQKATAMAKAKEEEARAKGWTPQEIAWANSGLKAAYRGDNVPASEWTTKIYGPEALQKAFAASSANQTRMDIADTKGQQREQSNEQRAINQAMGRLDATVRIYSGQAAKNPAFMKRPDDAKAWVEEQLRGNHPDLFRLYQQQKQPQPATTPPDKRSELEPDTTQGEPLKFAAVKYDDQGNVLKTQDAPEAPEGVEVPAAVSQWLQPPTTEDKTNEGQEASGATPNFEAPNEEAVDIDMTPQGPASPGNGWEGPVSLASGGGENMWGPSSDSSATGSSSQDDEDDDEDEDGDSGSGSFDFWV